ncbi:MAG TPA: hypothetical protein DF383_11335, partial [Deltaproteobacteria bacterium]|nr:hypothetical protein [Deltaproteobacteria bacterium]
SLAELQTAFPKIKLRPVYQKAWQLPFNIGPKIHNVIPADLKQLIEEFFSLRNWKGLYLTGGT